MVIYQESLHDARSTKCKTEFSLIGDYQCFGITSCCQLLIAGSMFLQTFGNYHNITQPHRARIFITNTNPHATMISLSFTLECLIICAMCMLTSCNTRIYHDISTNRKIHVLYQIELSSAAVKLRCSILLAPQKR